MTASLRFMRHAAVVALLLAVPAAAESSSLYVTEMGRRVLAAADVVVEARVTAMPPSFRGVSTARLAVDHRFLGYERRTTLTLMYIEDYLAPDALGSTLDQASVSYEKRRKASLKKALRDLSRGDLPTKEEVPAGADPDVSRSRETTRTPSAGTGVGVRLAKGEEGLFFLVRQGATYRLAGLVPRRDPRYAAKRQRLEDVLKIEAIPQFDRRVEQAKRFFLGGLVDPDPWVRGNSAREIVGLARRYGAAFRPAETLRIAERLHDESEPRIRARLERAVRALAPRQAEAFAEVAEEEERARFADALGRERQRLDGTRNPDLLAADLRRLARRYRRAGTLLLTSYLEHDAPLVRESAAQALAEYGGPSCRPGLRTALAGERDPDACRALLYACGVHADPAAVDAVRARLKDPRLARAAVHALARIGTKEARTALQVHAAGADEPTRTLIGGLLAEEFTDES